MAALTRLLRAVRKTYPVIYPLALIAIVITSAIRSLPGLFMEKVVTIVDEFYPTGDWAGAYPQIRQIAIVLLILYGISLVTSIIHTQLMVYIGQDFMKKLRDRMFEKMQTLPIKYFDTNQHGDIMSRYTNDIDSIRQLVSQALPNAIFSGVMVLTVAGIMAYLSFNMFLIVIVGLIVMLLVTQKIGGNSAKYFRTQQRSIGKTEGLIEEIMHGQRVVKVFNEEEAVIEKFNHLNEQLFRDANRANTFANILMPITFSISNFVYVIVAIAGGAMVINNVPNYSFSGIAMGVAIVVPFLQMTRQLMGNVSMLSNQINSVAMALAGAERIFELIDQESEIDQGEIELVNACYRDGVLTEQEEECGIWAWRKRNEDGSYEYRQLKGEVILENVNFGYDEDKLVLKDISLYAKPGEKVAFVGSTGAGKTTITNLINRFYEINSGTITYDGIDISDIKKADLRRSLGLVLQDTNLFTGTVMDNIRYGKSEASNLECIMAAKLVNAHDFIMRLPQGYLTEIDGSNDSLSQGQRQLISIARAAIMDPPVMILDEATSSIDTRTEVIITEGMDALMANRTVFVIAHRLSTIRNSDVIMVLEDGRIIERGSHDELLEEKGTYYELYTGKIEMQ